jgi:hypothetical protein
MRDRQLTSKGRMMTQENGAASPANARRSSPSIERPTFTRILLGVVFGFFACAATMALGFAIGLALIGKDRLLETGTWDATAGAQIAAVALAGVGAFFVVRCVG